jgi:DNA-binding NtrC family response regulator
MPGLDGMQVLKEIREKHPECAVVMISANTTLDVAVEAMRLGAVDYIRKPFQAEDVKILVTRLTEKIRLEREVNLYRDREQSQYRLDSLVGVSPQVREIRELIGKIAGSDASNILVEGESGTGKGLVAKIIHYSSRQQRKPFMEVSCTALTESLVESELFGHEKGAFTDAKATKKGMFEQSNGGTIFLDEIGDMPLASQAKLLRALEDRLFKRVGGVRDIRVDVRVVAATNRNLEQEVAAERFRKDLFYRLAVLRVHIAPLRSRPEDVPHLCAHFIHHFNREFRRSYQRVSPDALKFLSQYRWPGNVRELRNVIERAMILEDKTEILPKDLPPDLRSGGLPDHPAVPISLPNEGVSMEEVERSLIIKALEASHGNQSRAAKFLKMSRDTLRYRMKKFGIGRTQVDAESNA